MIGNPLPFVSRRTIVLNDGVTYNKGDHIEADVFAKERQRDVLMSAGYVEQYWDMHFRRTNIWQLNCRRPSHHPAGDETVWDGAELGPLFLDTSVGKLVSQYGPNAVPPDVLELWMENLVDDEAIDVDGDVVEDVVVPGRWSA